MEDLMEDEKKLNRRTIILQITDRDDGRYMEVRDQKGVKQLHRCDSDDIAVDLTIETQTGELIDANIRDWVSDPFDE
jgi:hypothetical protein